MGEGKDMDVRGSRDKGEVDVGGFGGGEEGGESV